MSTIAGRLTALRREIPPHVTLIAVSKTRPVSDILEAYEAGQRDFGENYVQELLEKQPQLPADIRWHFIGHLQSNKVKAIAPFIHCIHAIDSAKLWRETEKQASQKGRIIQCLLQVHIAKEDSKYGLKPDDVLPFLHGTSPEQFHFARLSGLMGMASMTDDNQEIEREFTCLQELFHRVKRELLADAADFNQLSSGMSGDWRLAVLRGSTMVRIGSSIFGSR